VVRGLGADVRRGGLDDPAGLAEAADASDGVVHLAFIHDFSRMGDAAAADRAAIDAMGTAPAGSGRPLLIASGLMGLTGPSGAATERDTADPSVHPRIANAQLALSYAERGVRPIIMRFAPTVHGAGDHGFVAVLVDIARERGTSAFIGDGGNRWPAVHRQDAATLVRLALSDAPAGSVWHASAESGIPTRDIATAIGAGLGLPVIAVEPEAAAAHFGWMGMFFGADCAASSDLTRQQLGWTPTHATLLDDLATGAYFEAAAA
jgi:nucleoside-diphosphate-sugar epimerase